MKDHVEEVSKWIYRGVWGVLTRWFKVPDQPPSLPTRPGETSDSFRPALGFLRYLKFHFWVFLVLIDGAIFVGWLVICIVNPIVGAMLALPAFVIAVVPDIVAYIAIHLRYDTTWYVFTDRSLRIRRGIWIIHETTITFDNIQNVGIRQGPLQRWFGISNIIVETAGGGGSGQQGEHGHFMLPHQGLIEGVADAHRIRDLLMARLRKLRTTGLGDEETKTTARSTWTKEHLDVLREIRDVAGSLASSN